MRRFPLTGLFFSLFLCGFYGAASAQTFSVTEIKLDRVLGETRGPVSVDAGDGIRLK